jgi:hypothetical protein
VGPTKKVGQKIKKFNLQSARVDTRQKVPLLSASPGALGKEYFKKNKN